MEPLVLSKEEEFGIPDTHFVDEVLCLENRSLIMVDVYKRIHKVPIPHTVVWGCISNTYDQHNPMNHWEYICPLISVFKYVISFFQIWGSCGRLSFLYWAQSAPPPRGTDPCQCCLFWYPYISPHVLQNWIQTQNKIDCKYHKILLIIWSQCPFAVPELLQFNQIAICAFSHLLGVVPSSKNTSCTLYLLPSVCVSSFSVFFVFW